MDLEPDLVESLVGVDLPWVAPKPTLGGTDFWVSTQVRQDTDLTAADTSPGGSENSRKKFGYKL